MDKFIFSIITSQSCPKDNIIIDNIVTFEKGCIDDLIKFITIKDTKTNKISVYIYGYSIYQIISSVQRNRDTAFTHYYFDRKNEILSWFDNQTTQISLLLHGKSRTGKTEFAKCLSHHTGKSVICVDLLKIKKLSVLLSLLYRGILIDPYGFNEYFEIKDLIFFFDEFDKTLDRLNIIQQTKRDKDDKMFSILVNRKDNEKDKTGDKDITDEYDWTLDDLLSIFSGVYTPEDRTIIATANDIDIVKRHCPYLIGCGRMTPIEFDYGDRDMFLEIVKDLSGITIPQESIRDNFKFIQANLIEYIKFNKSIDATHILSNLDKFVAPQ